MTDLEKSLTDGFIMIWRALKAADTDLEAHKRTISALLAVHPELKESLDAYLAAARQAPALLEKMNQKYASGLGTFLLSFSSLLQRVPDDLSAKEVLNLLEGLE
jgi:hypothetical protein